MFMTSVPLPCVSSSAMLKLHTAHLVAQICMLFGVHIAGCEPLSESIPFSV